MPRIPSKMLNNLSKTDKKVVINWWNTLSQKIQEKLLILYDIDRSENQSFTSLSYYVEFVEKEPIQDVYKYKEDLIEFYISHEADLNQERTEYAKIFIRQTVFSNKSKYQILLDKYKYPNGYYTLFSIY